jgi:hypothetical protein
MLYVLIGGLVLAAIYLIGTQIWSNSETLPPAGQIDVAPTVDVVPPAINPAPVTPVTPAPAVTPTPVTPAPVTPAP